MAKYHPKNWSLICWLTSLAWLIFAITKNVPYDFDPPPAHMFVDDNIPKGISLYAANGFVTPVGWPITYLDIHYKKSYIPPTKTLNILFVVLNLLIIATVQFSIVHLLQDLIPKIGIRSMLAGTAVIAAGIMIGRFEFIAFDYYYTYYYRLSWYFAPMAICAAFVTLRYFRLRMKTLAG